MPVPVKEHVVPTDKLPSMVAWYRLQTSSIAVNLAQMKHVLLTATEQEHCTPIYSIIVMSETLYISWLVVIYVQLHCLWKIQRM